MSLSSSSALPLVGINTVSLSTEKYHGFVLHGEKVSECVPRFSRFGRLVNVANVAELNK